MTRLPPSAIRCIGLCKAYDGVRAACGVTLSVQRGDFVALLGPSGCGKTTVLRMLAGLERPDKGHIEIGGTTVAAPGLTLPPEQRKVGMVFQEYALFPHLSVRGNVAFGLRGMPDRDQRVDKVLELVDLTDIQHRGPHALSGGQQQRVAIARALAPGPDVILLDEPFSNLDAALRQRVRQEIREILLHAGVTTVFVTHDQEEALSLSDHLAVMIEGQIMQFGPPEELYRFPATKAVAAFLGDTNFLPGEALGSRISCELGTLDLHQDMQGAARAMVRPENLSLSASPNSPATVIAREYVGHSWILRVRLESGLIVRSRLTGAAPPLEIGIHVQPSVRGPVMAYSA